MSDNIPFEIQTKIIKRVPVKSLFRFRSVSKSWKSLIDSSQFIADYNEYQSRPQRLFIRYKYDPKSYASVCVVDDDIFPQNKFAATVPGIIERGNKLMLVGSSQGLLCLLADYSLLFLWNPAIRKEITINVFVPYDIHRVFLGFGVCPNTNEPMLVQLDGMFWRVKVFTLYSRVWRRPRCNLLPRESIRFAQSQVAIDGFIYWQTFDQIIVSFDMTSEEFAEINLPRSLAYTSGKDLSISNLRESLAVLEHYTDAGKPVCAVWMMEHGVPKSFTKLFTVSTPNACLIKVLGFRKNGEVILEAKTDDYEETAVLKVCDPHSELIYKDLGIKGGHGSFFVASYKETLLLLDQPAGDQIINESRSIMD